MLVRIPPYTIAGYATMFRLTTIDVGFYRLGEISQVIGPVVRPRPMANRTGTRSVRVASG
jgi:hypothetical protein